MDEVRHADVTTTRHVLQSTVGNQNQQIDMVMFVRGAHSAIAHEHSMFEQVSIAHGGDLSFSGSSANSKM